MKKITFTLFLLFISFSTITAQSWENKIDDRLDIYDGTTEQFEFLVQFVNQADVTQAKFLNDKTAKGTLVMDRLKATTQRTQAEVVNILDSKKVPFQSFWIANVIWIHGDYELVKQLAQRPEVNRISENTRMKMLEPIEPELENLNKNVEFAWGILHINADDVWNMGYTGKGVVVGGQDTGYEWEHESIKEKYRGWDGTNADHNYNWHDAIHEFDSKHDTTYNPCGLDVDVPCDDHNHGTHTMGTMVGGTNVEKIGVAPDASWIGCRNMERGWGTPQTYLECFQWFLAPTDLNGENADPSKAPHVINNSWGCPDIEGCNPNNFNILEAAVNNLKAAGVVVVVSAGNSGSACETINTPAAIFENSFSIGALSQNDTIAIFSSRGLVTVDGSNRIKPNVAAPGVSIKSAIRNNRYASFSGTSMAGPHVAGLVALMISADPSLAGDVERIETLIEQTAIPRMSGQDCGTVQGSSIPNAVYGHGTIDAIATINAILQSSTITESFRVYPNPTADVLSFHYIGSNSLMNLQIFAADGKQVVNQTLNYSGGNKIRNVSLAKFGNGVYYYRLCDDSGENCMDGKILKQ